MEFQTENVVLYYNVRWCDINVDLRYKLLLVHVRMLEPGVVVLWNREWRSPRLELPATWTINRIIAWQTPHGSAEGRLKAAWFISTYDCSTRNSKIRKCNRNNFRSSDSKILKAKALSLWSLNGTNNWTDPVRWHRMRKWHAPADPSRIPWSCSGSNPALQKTSPMSVWCRVPKLSNYPRDLYTLFTGAAKNMEDRGAKASQMRLRKEGRGLGTRYSNIRISRKKPFFFISRHLGSQHVLPE